LRWGKWALIGGSLFFVLACLGSAGAVGQVGKAEPIPTPTLAPPVLDAAAIVDATFDGLDTLQVDLIMERAAEAQRADTYDAHTSELGQLIQDTRPLLPLCIVGVLGATVVLLAGLGGWVLVRLRQGSENEKLALALEKAQALMAVHGGAPPPAE